MVKVNLKKNDYFISVNNYIYINKYFYINYSNMFYEIYHILLLYVIVYYIELFIKLYKNKSFIFDDMSYNNELKKEHNNITINNNRKKCSNNFITFEDFVNSEDFTPYILKQIAFHNVDAIKYGIKMFIIYLPNENYTLCLEWAYIHNFGYIEMLINNYENNNTNEKSLKKINQSYVCIINDSPECTSIALEYCLFNVCFKKLGQYDFDSSIIKNYINNYETKKENLINFFKFIQFNDGAEKLEKIKK